MTIELTLNEFEEQFEETDEEQLQWDASDKLDITYKFDAQVSQGWRREIDLREGLQLWIDNHRLQDRLVLRSHVKEFECIHFNFTLSGQGETIYANKTDALLEPSVTGKYFLMSNGLQPSNVGDYSDIQPYSHVHITVSRLVLCSFVTSAERTLPKSLKHVIRQPNQEAYLRSGDTQPSMATVVQQILHCPYQGMIKRAYLESKAIELVALVLNNEAEIQRGEVRPGTLKTEQLERVHYAKEILLRDMSNPPSLEELAHQVGLNDFLLKKGFRQAFGTTVFGELQAYRLDMAKQLLAEQDISVSKVAHLVGYASRSSFSKSFRQRFGVSPKQYQKECR
mgnify:CR=1 FL=1